MTFLHPLVFVLILPLTYLIYWLLQPVEKGETKLFAPEVFHRLFVSQGASQKIRLSLLWFAGVMMITSLARPVLPPESSTLTQEGYDILMALDLSASMQATDLSPSRLEAAKETMTKIIKAYPQHRFGVIGFSSHPFVIAPLTNDTETLLYLIESLETQAVVAKGTNLLGAIHLASKLSRGSHKALLIFSDGGDGENFSQEIALANKNAMTLYPIATATSTGTTLLDENNQTLKDRQGRIVVSAIHPDIEELATKTGGKSVTLGLGGEMAVMDHIASRFSPMITTQMTMFNKREFFLYPLWIGVIALLLALFRPHFSWGKGVMKMVILLGLIHLPLRASLWDFHWIKQGEESYQGGEYEKAIASYESLVASNPTPQALYNLGCAYYKAKRYTQAIATYEKVASKERILMAKVGHNIANAYAMKEDYHHAKIFYQRSLALVFDQQTWENLQKIQKLESLQTAQITQKGKSSENNETDDESSASTKGGKSGETSSMKTSSGSGSQTQKSTNTQNILGKLSNKKPPSPHQWALTSSQEGHDEKPW